MLVLINGLPHFSKKLADGLNNNQDGVRFVFCNTYQSKLDQIKFLLLLPFAKAVISMNGVSDKSGSLSWVLRLKKKLIMQWMGTDILNALKHQQEGNIYRAYLDYATHWVDASWLKDEVEQLGVKAELVQFKKVEPVVLTKGFLELELITYIPEARKGFYGLDQIIELAYAFPQLKFHLFGMNKGNHTLPSNVHCHGWTSEKEFLDKMRQCAVFIRLTEHDGNSLSVIQALNKGCEVVWNYPAPHVHYTANPSQNKKALQEALEQVSLRNLTPNTDNHTYVQNVYSEPVIRMNYIKKVLEVIQHG
jgi:hypothetical protein